MEKLQEISSAIITNMRTEHYIATTTNDLICRLFRRAAKQYTICLLWRRFILHLLDYTTQSIPFLVAILLPEFETKCKKLSLCCRRTRTIAP
ncbi:unnamed protein product [Adineta ricciae]|uniref:Uncharacterized protein n=1 Tax=Adineta ricciae TaxID=249248 RepID=A0A816EUU9_ADIRI|nr:unnamed protein product [Adineta ricciae]CAF1650824.1 unnamed protein product [Adineta ricciae]